ncbi:unnamed protein product [Rotaria magnacalcarata]|uniref:Uncharacterized protein n=1 Tax=Rotaria magnacalcarata TaxID=392030 RepID=A0A817A4P3_9BILA|nr:unnamed protein product [Rotaria magnacalcarata]CAF2123197.1 unnamed protein product [Rotaria magnacalcarata]CAF2152680.1 unnamed protein product [Rotaria magnacalcarata]CAF2244132.1 unnamed protein product [Rotaria magnacalcarata]CAF3799069.1 unnamed protein product [Rotaria magnacalcarata]
MYPPMSYNADILTGVKTEVVTIKETVRIEWKRISINVVTLSISITTNIGAIVSFYPLIEKVQCIQVMCDDEVIWMKKGIQGKLKLLKYVRGIDTLSENEFTNTVSIRVTSGEYKFLAY